MLHSKERKLWPRKVTAEYFVCKCDHSLNSAGGIKLYHSEDSKVSSMQLYDGHLAHRLNFSEWNRKRMIV